VVIGHSAAGLGKLMTSSGIKQQRGNDGTSALMEPFSTRFLTLKTLLHDGANGMKP
jgi:hypothetical protein